MSTSRGSTFFKTDVGGLSSRTNLSLSLTPYPENIKTAAGVEPRAAMQGNGQELRMDGQWSTNKQEMHINCLELLAASLAVQVFAEEKRNVNMLANTTLLHIIG